MADWVEEYLLFLRGQGPEPDLSGLSPDRREEIRGQFEVVKALVASIADPIGQDPVARRLGVAEDGWCSECRRDFRCHEENTPCRCRCAGE